MGALTLEQLSIAACKELGIGAAGEPIQSEDLLDVAYKFNLVVDTWKAQRLMIYQTLRLTFTITPNTPSVTIGPGGVFGTSLEGVVLNTQPQAIVRAGFVNTYVNPQQPLETPIHVYSDEEWASIGLKSLTSTIQWGVWYETTYGASANNAASFATGCGTLWFFPILTTGGTIALYLPVAIDEVAEPLEENLAQTIYCPPGYRKALIMSMAMEAADIFDMVPSANLIRKFNSAMKVVKRSNSKMAVLRIPQALSRRGLKGGGFNILTNQSNW